MIFRPTAEDRKLFLVLLAGLVVLAWAALVAWERSPYGRYLDHRGLAEVELGATGHALTFALLFTAGWALMTLAMMLPTSLPLVQMFARMMRRRANGGQLVALLLAGYIGVWSAFGAGAHFGDWVLHQLVEPRLGWLEDRPWAIGAATLAAAGGYQFTPLKYMCLDKCRSPLAFISEHWHGRSPRREALELGVRHGVFCVGCCWSLMLLMFVVGVGSVGWMLLLGAVMAVEKNMPGGRRLSAPLGVGLVGAALAVLALSGGEACAAHVSC